MVEPHGVKTTALMHNSRSVTVWLDARLRLEVWREAGGLCLPIALLAVRVLGALGAQAYRLSRSRGAK